MHIGMMNRGFNVCSNSKKSGAGWYNTNAHSHHHIHPHATITHLVSVHSISHFKDPF
jgi:hypothetical protein